MKKMIYNCLKFKKKTDSIFKNKIIKLYLN